MDAFTLYLSERAPEGGFIRDVDLPGIIAGDRLRVLLVRCGATRFMASAQNIAGMIAAVEASGDYVRDVSFPAGDPIFRGNYSWRATPTINNGGAYISRGQYSSREDYSGAFDGFSVTSDADSGL